MDNNTPHSRSEGPALHQLSRLGHTSGRRHIAGFAIVLCCWVILGSVAALALMLALGDFRTGSITAYLIANAPFPLILAGVLIAVRWVHGRPIWSLVTPTARLDLRRIAMAFGLMFALAAASTLIEALIEPGRFQFSFRPSQRLVTLPVIVVITSLQTTTEELLFRGYLLQALGLLTSRTWLLVAISSVLFGVLHLLNPEIGASSVLLAAVYFLFAAFFTLLTLRDNRLELAIGAHAANNLFATLIVNHQTSSLPTPAIWQSSEHDPVFVLASFLVSALLFYWLTVGRRSVQES